MVCLSISGVQQQEPNEEVQNQQEPEQGAVEEPANVTEPAEVAEVTNIAADEKEASSFLRQQTNFYNNSIPYWFRHYRR